MISAGDLRKGTTFEYEGQVYTVIDFLHVKPGKGAAFVRTKLRNVISGGVTDTTFNPTAKLQIPLNYEKVEEAIKFIKENMFAVIKFYKGEAFSVEAPNFVELLITQADPGVKGNTATNAMKPATLETGAVVNVPMFVNEGDTIRVDTRTGEYMERV